MRAIIQRVTSASVSVGGKQISAIGPGLCVLVGITRADADKDAEYICRKVLNMKLWDDPKTGKPWQRSVVRRSLSVQHSLCCRHALQHPLLDTPPPTSHLILRRSLSRLTLFVQMSAGYEVLFVSQFTLYAATHKGNRPDFSKAMGEAAIFLLKWRLFSTFFYRKPDYFNRDSQYSIGNAAISLEICCRIHTSNPRRNSISRDLKDRL